MSSIGSPFEPSPDCSRRFGAKTASVVGEILISHARATRSWTCEIPSHLTPGSWWDDKA